MFDVLFSILYYQNLLFMHMFILIIAKSSIVFQCYYLSESKVLQYFGNMRHDSRALDAFAEIIKDVRCWARLILSKCFLIDLLLWLEAQPQYPVLGLPDLAWSLRFLEPEWNFLNYLIIVINYAFTFLYNKCFWFLLWCYGPVQICKSSQIRLLDVHLCSFQIIHWVMQCVSAPTTMILSSMVGICHSLNGFSHIIYTMQISTYQNVAELLTQQLI